MLDVTKGRVNFRFKPSIGYSYIRPLGSISPLEQQRIDDGTLKLQQAFYNVEIQLLETRTGVKLGGRIRNYINNNDQTPTYTIFLSKQFSLSKLGEFITSK